MRHLRPRAACREAVRAGLPFPERRRRTGRALLALWAFLLFPPFAGEAAAKGPEVRDLMVEREGDRLLVSFELVDAFDDGLLERIESGLPTGFKYQIKLEKIRRWWFDNRIDRSELEVIAMYNALTREYLVNFKQDGRLIDSQVKRSRAELEQAMTHLHALPVHTLDRPRPGRWVVRVRAELGSKTVLLLFPTTRHTAWADSEVFTGRGPDATISEGVRPAANPDTR